MHFKALTLLATHVYARVLIESRVAFRQTCTQQLSPPACAGHRHDRAFQGLPDIAPVHCRRPAHEHCQLRLAEDTLRRYVCR